MAKSNPEVEFIKIGEFSVVLIKTMPMRIEAKIIFDREHISQKLVFTLMDMAHKHGFGCSSPKFGLPDKDSMTFLVGLILPTQRSLKKYLTKMSSCLEEISEFVKDFIKQLNFTNLDISMFSEIEASRLFPEQLAAIRDQFYHGSWEEYFEDLLEEGKEDEAEIVARCVEFESLNKKDVGLVGHKLDSVLQYFDKQISTQSN